MSDHARGRPQEERLPWLEPVEDEDEDAGSAVGRVIFFLAVLLGLFAVGAGAYLWFRDRDVGVAGSGELIRAPAEPYREKPREAGGMRVDGTGELAYGASEGVDIDSAIDLSALPETPVTGPGSEAGADVPVAILPPPAAPTPAAASPLAGAAPAVPQVKPPVTAQAPADRAPRQPAGRSGSIQLGAFSSEAKARSAWKSLSARFGFLSGLEISILPVKTDDATLYRLRAGAGGQAGSICARLRVAGESCSIVN
ncbi:sporulation protein [Sphingomonas oleivorans]|uniref:Sporulation protein n=1 Tax=Sphingomonas oleivorans TaxID=1735121 RepID=A0A2T5FYC1_9SPHN|nr:SPOR domain-containing protein [Sphingomonas oleivorans]PTQ11484.1 sporulation protein [Sphingomonas oleivorans]